MGLLTSVVIITHTHFRKHDRLALCVLIVGQGVSRHCGFQLWFELVPSG
jgi:hypothetical protein